MMKSNNSTLAISKFISIISIAIVLLCGCHSQKASENNHFSEGEYTFIKVYDTPVGDVTPSDSMVLRLEIKKDARVSGTYRWVIPGKDGKSGAISGELSQDTIYGTYSYMQEGGRYNDSVQIVLVKDSAIVTQFSADHYQLIDTLTQK